MANLFDIVKKNEVVLSPDTLAIPVFNTIWDRDKGRNKPTANKEIKYIVFLCHHKSPYRDVSEHEKEKLIRSDVFGPRSSWEPDEVVQQAIKTYDKLYTTRHMRLLKATFKTEEEITKYFENIDMSQTDDFGRPLYTMENIIKNLEKVGNVILSISKLEKQVKAEMADLAVRGGNETGYYENPESVKGLKDK